MKLLHVALLAGLMLTAACSHREAHPLSEIQNYPQNVQSPVLAESWEHKAWREKLERKAQDIHASGAAKSYAEALGQAELIAGPEPMLNETAGSKKSKDRVLSSDELDRARGKKD